ncbi:MAG: DNA polymerase III subunit delta [Pseudomonadales bacterium]
MAIRLDQLEAHLQQGLKPIYIVSGDEPLQVQEACQLIRSAAKAAQFDERETLIADSNFNWDELLSTGNALSLFAAQKLIDLRLASGKPGNEGAKALLSYAENPPESNLLLISTGKLDKAAKNSKWFKALSGQADHIEIWPIEAHQLPKWIEQRMRRNGLAPERDAVTLLAELVDGNLLAASQEIEKLKLLLQEGDSRITADTIRHCVVDSSRYNLFSLVDNALKGDASQCLKMLTGLHQEGVEPLQIIWALSREVRQLAMVAHAIQSGQQAEQAMQSLGIWRNRQPLVGKAVSRLSTTRLDALTRQIAEADQMAKGIHRGNLWNQLERITLQLAGAPLPNQ